MKRLLLFLVVAVGVGFGQPTSTVAVYELIAEDVEAVPTLTANVTNVGQVGHLFILFIEDNPPNACVIAAAGLQATVEGSYDNIRFINLDNTLVMFESGIQPTYTDPFSFIAGKAAFPYIRLRIQTLDTVNCQVDVYYSGSQTDMTATNNIFRVEAAGPTDNRPNTLIGFWTSWDRNASLTAQAPFLFDGTAWDRLLDCEHTIPIIVGAATTLELVALVADESIRVCSFSMTMAAAGTAQFVYGTGANCVVGTTAITGAYDLGAGFTAQDGDNIGRLFTAAVSNALCLVTTGGGATAAGLLTYAQYE